MRAVVARPVGGPVALDIVEVTTPEPGPGQVLIRVEAAAVNPVDELVRSGGAVELGLVTARDALGVGWDVAGVVDQVGDGVDGVAVGERVIGLSDRLDVTTGTHAEYVVLDADTVARAPRGASPEAAAGLPLNGLTAPRLLADLDLAAGSTLLVTGAAGGVGGYAVELAAAAGLRVAGDPGVRGRRRPAAGRAGGARRGRHAHPEGGRDVPVGEGGRRLPAARRGWAAGSTGAGALRPGGRGIGTEARRQGQKAFTVRTSRLWKTASPSQSLAIRSANSPVAGLAELAMAEAWSSKATTWT